MYNIAICDLYHPVKYGHTSSSSAYIDRHFMVYVILDTEEFFDEEEYIESQLTKLWVLNNSFNNLVHPVIKTYNHYIFYKKYNNIEIVETYCLDGGESIAILKTFWISIIQRRWKKVFHERKRVLHIRSMPTSLLYREIHGTWPKLCSVYPLFKLNIY